MTSFVFCLTMTEKFSDKTSTPKSRRVETTTDLYCDDKSATHKAGAPKPPQAKQRQSQTVTHKTINIQKPRQAKSAKDIISTQKTWLVITPTSKSRLTKRAPTPWRTKIATYENSDIQKPLCTRTSTSKSSYRQKKPRTA